MVNEGRFQDTVADGAVTRQAPKAAAFGKRPPKGNPGRPPYPAVSPVRRMTNEFAPATDWVCNLVCNKACGQKSSRS